jgi:uncharacterized OB-fold protein
VPQKAEEQMTATTQGATASTGAKARVPAIEGWFSLDGDTPHLIGTRCTTCQTYFFPKETFFCRNPDCMGDEFEEVELSRTGKIWSYTTNHYQPPSPYMPPDPFVPYTIAAVELDREKMVVLGQMAAGIDPHDLTTGMGVELVLETLYESDESDFLVWKWKPVDA